MAAALTLVPNDTDLAASRRAAKRSRVMLSAAMTSGATEIPVVIRDVSSTGALIVSPVAPDVGSYVNLRRDPVAVVARVAWRDGRKIGLQFRGEIDESALLIALRRS